MHDQFSFFQSSSGWLLDCSVRGEEGDAGKRDEVDASINVETWLEWLWMTVRLVDRWVDEEKVVDWVDEQRCSGCVARRTDGKWSTWMLSWEPVRGLRAQGRPATCWEDSPDQFMGGNDRWVKVV